MASLTGEVNYFKSQYEECFIATLILDPPLLKEKGSKCLVEKHGLLTQVRYYQHMRNHKVHVIKFAITFYKELGIPPLFFVFVVINFVISVNF